MEIVLAVLLLFGGFTLGSITADEASKDTPSAVIRPDADGVPDSHQVTQTMRRENPIRCDIDGTIIYRDLTVPYSSQHMSQVGDCDGECPDE